MTISHPSKRDLMLALWGLLFITWAEAQSFVDVIFTTDYKSLMLAAGVALIASGVRTTLTLFSAQPIYQVWRETVGDLLVAFCAGGVAYMILEVLLQEDVWHPQRMTRLLIIGIAGVMRGSFFTWFSNTVKDFLTALHDRVVGFAKQKSPKV